MRQYLDLVEDILENGRDREDRTGTGTRSVFGRTIRFDLQEGFPLCTTRKMWFDGIVDELMWFLSGSTNVNDLGPAKKIWDEQEWWVNDSGYLGPSYGKQFRGHEIAHINTFDITPNTFWEKIIHFFTGENRELDRVLDKLDEKSREHYNGRDEYWDEVRDIHHDLKVDIRPAEYSVDQLQYVIDDIRENPFSRRHVLSTWQQPDMRNVPLPCCHGTKIQFYVRDETEVVERDNDTYGEEVRYLDCHMDARSQDVMIGMPWNIASYALLTHMIAYMTGCKPGEYIHTGGDCHIYINHIEKAKEQIEREPYPLPKMEINRDGGLEDISAFVRNDFSLDDYRYHPKIDYEISV